MAKPIHYSPAMAGIRPPPSTEGDFYIVIIIKLWYNSPIRNSKKDSTLEKRWIFLTDEMQREIALNLPSYSLADGLILESSTLATPMGVVFDFWNQGRQQLAAGLLHALIGRVGVIPLSQAATRALLYLETFEALPKEVLKDFRHFLNVYGLMVV